jgi:hypothetical protein
MGSRSGLATTAKKYLDFEKNQDLQRWLRNVRRGSPVHAEIVRRQLGRLCELLSTTPEGMVKQAKNNKKGFQDSLEDLVAQLEAEGKSPGYIIGLLKAVRSWLRYNDVALMRGIKVSNRNATPTIENEQVPTQAELARILRTSPPRIRLAEALMAFADLRPESIGNFDGTDGLTLKDFPELRIDDRQATFEKIPTMVAVRSSLSKTRGKYFTFLSHEGCDYLKEYLEERMTNGEKLTPESPLIGHDRPGAAEKEFSMTKKISDFIRKYMRAAGVHKRPYVLRAYAETQLIIAESKGKISHPYLQFIAGHKGDIEARYSTNKGKLPPDMIEDMRAQYKACEPFLSTTSKLEESTVIKEAQIEALKSIAKNVFGINLIDAKIGKEKELAKELTPAEELEVYESEIRKLRIDPQKLRETSETGKFRNKLVREKELERYLNSGWEMVQTVNSRILVRKPILTSKRS